MPAGLCAQELDEVEGWRVSAESVGPTGDPGSPEILDFST
jgi:hypothetical protein